MSSAEWLAQGSSSMRAVLSAWRWQHLGQPLGNWLSLSCPQPSHHCIQKQACAQSQPWASSSSFLTKKKIPSFHFPQIMSSLNISPSLLFPCAYFLLPHCCRSRNFHTNNGFLQQSLMRISGFLAVVPQCCDQGECHARGPDDTALLQHRPHLWVPSRLSEGDWTKALTLVSEQGELLLYPHVKTRLQLVFPHQKKQGEILYKIKAI